ncbi:hypothetical protein [Nocardioides astragali]|uniref:Uncharacterized protein n=1 Tax=Nocardioides astragali TaxID=1776736 RepID=A0ABW2N7J7_9ACTN|nr:hypothetical protein [Nocardioides astragali]
MTSTHGAAEPSVLPSVQQTYQQATLDLTDAWILRAFDEARIALARREFDEDGVLLGFDALELNAELIGLPCAGPVRVTATLVDERGSCHAVEYRAALRGEGRPGSGGIILAQAAGWTWVPSRGALSLSLVRSSTPVAGDGT